MRKFVVISGDQGPIRVAGTFSIQAGRMTLYLNIFPGIPYFVVEDERERNKLRIFSGRSTRSSPRPFFNQVGTGKRIDQINAFEFFISDLNQKYYVYLNADHFEKSPNAA